MPDFWPSPFLILSCRAFLSQLYFVLFLQEKIQENITKVRLYRRGLEGICESSLSPSFFFFFLLGGLREDFPVTRLGLFPGKCHSTDCYPTWRSILHCCSKFPLALVIVLPFDVSSGSPWVRTKIFVLEGQTLINVTLFLLHDLLVLTLITYSCCNKKWIDGL